VLGELGFKEELVVLGWIHTHPDMEVFFSHPDVHNHHDIQLINPNAVGIVTTDKADAGNPVRFINIKPSSMANIDKCRIGNDKFHPGHKYDTQDSLNVFIHDGPNQIVDLREDTALRQKVLREYQADTK
jgi:proteasome lid subunit RPN8/RPN11